MLDYDRGGDDIVVFADVSNPNATLLFGDGSSVTGIERLNAKGGYNSDSLVGGVYDDTLDGGQGDDTLRSGLGDDVVVVSSLLDKVFDTGGIDELRTEVLHVLSLTDFSGFENIGVGPNGEGGYDLTGNNGDNLVYGGYGGDTLRGGKGLDTLRGGYGNDLLAGGAGGDLLDGGPGWVDRQPGVDVASYADATSGVKVSLALTTAQNTGGGGTDTLINMEGVIGSIFADTLTGAATDDSLYGGSGADSIVGGAGSDTLRGGADADTLNGGGGDDILSYVDAASGVSFSLALLGVAQNTGGDGVDTAFEIEGVWGSAFNDTLTGNSGRNVLYGMALDDILSGGDGVDTLDGGTGRDRLTGGKGVDELYGGEGIDAFKFDVLELSSDFIHDLTNEDRIDLSALDANANIAGNQAFVLVGTFTNTAGEAMLSFDGDAMTYLTLDVNGDGISDMAVGIFGDHDDFTNFVL